MSKQIDDFLIWVGGASYSRESLIKESRRMGVCRRIPFIPQGLVKGVSRVFMISDMNEEDRKRYKEEYKRRDKLRYEKWKELGFPKDLPRGTISVTGAWPRGTPLIFAYFIVRGISYIVARPDEEIRKSLKDRGVEKYEYVEEGFGFRDERDCGSLVIGGTYLLSEEDMEKCRDLAESGTLRGRIVLLNPPIPYGGDRFRGIKMFPRATGDRLVG